MNRSIVIELRVGETASIGDAVVTLEEKSGQRARLRVVAPPGVRVDPPARAAGSVMAKEGVLR
jgi:hypothetical protein